MNRNKPEGLDNPKKYKYRLGQEAFPLDLTGTTNLGEYGEMIKRSKITEGWGKNNPSIIERTHNEKESCINTDRYKKLTENISERYTAPKKYKEITKVKKKYK
jgi:hypothetical protein